MSNIYLYNHPILYCKLLFRALLRLLKKCSEKLLDYTLPSLLILYILFLISLLPGSHQYYLLESKRIILFTAYWITLGILSSIGLGTGLHTFILFLGPFIADLSSASSTCGFVPKLLPNRWEFEAFEDCEPKGSVNVFEIIWAVQLESVFWGFGTLIGELPPYLIAKNARFEDDDELEETKLKKMLREALQKYAFVTLCVCASVPNPLFDLAGLMAGHFGIPFWEFFIATGIGKAVVKVQIQVFLVALMFSGDFLERLSRWLEKGFPVLGNGLSKLIEKQKQASFKHNKDGKSILGYVWEGLIIVMVLFFVISLTNAVVKKERVNFM